MRSVRLEPELDARLKEAARIAGKPVSEVVREAVRSTCDRILGERLDRRLGSVIGKVSSGGGSSRKTGKAFTQLLQSKRRRKK